MTLNEIKTKILYNKTKRVQSNKLPWKVFHIYFKLLYHPCAIKPVIKNKHIIKNKLYIIKNKNTEYYIKEHLSVITEHTNTKAIIRTYYTYNKNNTNNNN